MITNSQNGLLKELILDGNTELIKFLDFYNVNNNIDEFCVNVLSLIK